MKGLQFPMNSNNKIGAKCLFNLYLKVSDKGILEDASIEDVKDENSDEEKDEEEEKEKEKKDQKADEEDQEPVTTATQEEAEVGSKGEQGEALCERETSKNEEAEELDDKDSSDEEVRISVKKKPTVTPRKSSSFTRPWFYWFCLSSLSACSSLRPCPQQTTGFSVPVLLVPR